MKEKSKKEKNESKTQFPSESSRVRLKVDPQKTIPYRQDGGIPKSRENKS